MIPPGPRLTDDGIPDDPDLQAAEYVLGSMTLEESLAFEALARGNGEVRASIQYWEDRLAPLADSLPVASPPPELWQRLALATGLYVPAGPPQPRRSRHQRSALSRAWGNTGLWRGISAASMAVAAGLALFVFAPSQLDADPLLAALSPSGAPGAVFLMRVDGAGNATVFAVGQPNTPEGRSLQLWALAAGSTVPTPLGLLSPSGQARLRVASAPGTRVLVSIEPFGGSPTGKPTGPVVYAGLLANGS